MPVKSLFDLATATCVKNLRGLESIGDYLPYDSVRHILLKVENAHQLRQIELKSPQIQGATGEIWLKLIEKDFPLEFKAKAYKPQNPDNWYRVWGRYKKDHDKALQDSENKLKDALAGLKQDKEKNTSRIIERKLLPKSVRLGGGKKLYSGHRDAYSSSLAFNAGSRTKTVNGASVMRKVRREVKEIATIHGSLSRPIRAPTRQSRLQNAPAAMVNDHRRAAQPLYRSTVLSTEPPSAVAEHEERATFISDSDEDDGDDLFDVEMPKATYKPPPSKLALEAASASLIKNNPLSPQAASSHSAIPSTSRTPKPAAGCSLVTRGVGLLSNKFKGSAAKVQAKSLRSSPPPYRTEPHKPPPQVEEAKSTQTIPHALTTPPPPAIRSSSSSPAPESLPPPSSESMPRKRKAVDIFMRRPKKK